MVALSQIRSGPKLSAPYVGDDKALGFDRAGQGSQKNSSGVTNDRAFARLALTMTTDADIYRRIGQRLRARRRALELTQAEVGRACDTTFQQIQRHEAGYHPMTVARLLRLAGVLQVNIGYFLEASIEETEVPFTDQKRAGGGGR
jgi:hypothetical protein